MAMKGPGTGTAVLPRFPLTARRGHGDRERKLNGKSIPSHPSHATQNRGPSHDHLISSAASAAGPRSHRYLAVTAIVTAETRRATDSKTARPNSAATRSAVARLKSSPWEAKSPRTISPGSSQHAKNRKRQKAPIPFGTSSSSAELSMLRGPRQSPSPPRTSTSPPSAGRPRRRACTGRTTRRAARSCPP